MTHSAKLPDAMPEIQKRTLLVVCDSHHCRFINVGGRTLLEQEQLASGEICHADRQSVKSGPGGGNVGIGDDHRAEDHRLTEFSKAIIARVASEISARNIESVHLSAPSKLLHEIKKHLTQALASKVTTMIDGTFVKESPLDVLVRFCPELKSAVQELRDAENYSAKKHLPK